jgi:hypothetical protein
MLHHRLRVMLRTGGVWALALVLLAGIALPLADPSVGPVAAQEGPNAWAFSWVRLYAGPARSYQSLAVLAPNTPLVLEARDGDGSWLLVRTLIGRFRGWVMRSSIGIQAGVNVLDLPIRVEIVGLPTLETPTPTPISPVVPPTAAPPTAPPPTATTVPAVVPGGFARQDRPLPNVGGIDLNAYPVVPAMTGRSKQIAARGRALGMNAHAIAKVGDCSVYHPYYLSPFYWDQYNLGDYGHLQATIDYFGESLAYDSQAAHEGFVVDAVIDPTWANPQFCQAGESALQCEFRRHRPGVALIMFGINDVQRRTAEQFYNDLRELVRQSAAAGVVPVLHTFPPHAAFAQESLLFNQIVVKVALESDVPLVNVWRAIQPLTNHGMAEDGTHLSGYKVGGACYLVAENLDTGFTMLNLVTLQTLNALRGEVLR